MNKEEKVIINPQEIRRILDEELLNEDRKKLQEIKPKVKVKILGEAKWR